MEKKTYYANCVNLSGLSSKNPIVCNNFNETSNSYWDKYGSIEVKPNKLEINKDGILHFASENKHDVELWTKGAMAVMELLNRFCENT